MYMYLPRFAKELGSSPTAYDNPAPNNRVSKVQLGFSRKR